MNKKIENSYFCFARELHLTKFYSKYQFYEENLYLGYNVFAMTQNQNKKKKN